MELNTQIDKIITYSKLSPSEFADAIEVSRGTISHILSKRNKPSIDVIAKIKEKFPELEWDWLIYGKGEMTRKKKEERDLFTMIEQDDFGISTQDNSSIKNEDISPTLVGNGFTNVSTLNDRKLIKVILIYDNGTFENFAP